MSHQRFPDQTPATEAALALTIKPFIERFVQPERSAKALSHFVPREARANWGDLAHMFDNARARPLEAKTIEPWHAVRGVLLVEHEAYSMSVEDAMKLYIAQDSLFVSYEATFAIARFANHGAPMLLT